MRPLIAGIGLALSLLPTLVTAQTPRAVVVASAAPIFVLPDQNRQPLRIAKEETVLNVISVEGEWYNVEFQDPELGRRVGYIQRKYLKNVGPDLRPMDLSVPEARQPVQPSTTPNSAAQAPASKPAALIADRAPVRTLKGGIVDAAQLYAARPPATHVFMRPFSTNDADIVNGDKKEETRTMQADGPRMLADRFRSKLNELGSFPSVTVLEPESVIAPDALIVEGKFTEIDPGSRAKRYFVGFGSGKSGVTVEGSVRSAEGVLLATFRQRRIGVMGAYGGDSLGKLASDTRRIGEDLAKFMSAWATGNLK